MYMEKYKRIFKIRPEGWLIPTTYECTNEDERLRKIY